MKYLLDTCVISELVAKQPNPDVVAWVDNLDPDSGSKPCTIPGPTRACSRCQVTGFDFSGRPVIYLTSSLKARRLETMMPKCGRWKVTYIVFQLDLDADGPC